MHLEKFALVLAFSIPLFLPLSDTANGASINLGGVTIKLPTVTKNRKSSRDTGRATQSRYANHPRWQVLVQDTYSYATNNEGIWIGYDDAGSMVLQLDMAVPAGYDAGAAIPVQVNVNGRLYDTIQGSVASDQLIVARGREVDRILERLISGREIELLAAGISIGTHLKGSSAAIREVRGAAALQARLYAQGKVRPKENKEPADNAENTVRYFLPGVPDTGVVEVRFDIVENTGLVLYMLFQEISGQGDPAHTSPSHRLKPDAP